MAADGGKELKAAPTVITGAERKSLDELQRDLEDGLERLVRQAMGGSAEPAQRTG